jgi:predicted dehydrogenase
VAVLGIGHAHAASKTSVLRDSADFELVGVCEPSTAVRQQLGGAPVYQGLRWLSVQDVVGDASIPFVAVESRVLENLAHAQQAIAAGKHVHLDKPPGIDLARLRSLLSEADRQQLVVQMGYMWRYHPGIQAALEAARRGWLGQVYMFRGVISSDIAPVARPALAPDARAALVDFPGGMMFELGCHLIDRMVDLLGRPSKVSSFLRHDSSHDDRLADNTLAIFEYDRALGEIYSSGQQPAGGSHRLLQIQGSNGTVTLQPIQPPSLTIDLKEAAGPYRAGPQRVTVEDRPRYVEDFREMAQIIRGQRRASFSSKHDLMAHETLLRACGVL